MTNTQAIQTEAAERLAAKKQIVAANRAAVSKLKSTINSIVNELALDEERMDKRVDSATRSEYGTINGLINLVASIANWPAEPGDGSQVSTNRRVLEDKFELDLMLLEDIRNYRGYHSFVTDDLEIIDGTEPDYENYTDYCEIFLETLGVSSNRPSIDAAKWNRAEDKAKAKALEDLASMKEELEKFNQFVEQKSAE